MWIHRLYIKNFRNYPTLDISFDKGINVITGENGQGKTNLIEAIHFALTGRSFRTEKPLEIIQKGKEEVFTQVHYDLNAIRHAIQITFGMNGKKITHDATTYPSFSSLTGTVPTVAITPGDIELIMGAPIARRRCMNLLIAQHDPLYAHQLSRYQKALKARNILLKRNSHQSIKIYEELLAESGVYIVQARLRLIQELSELLQYYFFELTQKKIPVICEYTFKGKIDKAYFLEQHEKNRHQEERIGSTLFGPHRDDILFLLDSLDAKLYASEGQKRALLTSWKLAELKLLKNKTQLDPILFIDDFAIHLDLYRSKLLETLIQNYPQVFLTTPHNIFEDSSLYFVQNTTVQKLSSCTVNS
jgi:DNA replication and repair protein RecF